MNDFIELTHMNGDVFHVRPESIVFFHRMQLPNGELMTFVRMPLMEPNTILVRDSPDEISASIYAYNQSKRSSANSANDMMVSMLAGLLGKISNDRNEDESDTD